jgi:hypothetical protein
MSGMTLLPQEFSSSNERSGMLEFPSNDIGPLIEFQGKMSMTLNPSSIGRVHNSFRSGSDSDGFREIGRTTFSDPSDFGGETFDVILFSHEGLIGNKHREISIFNAICLDESVKEFCDLFPNKVGSGSKNIAPRNFVVVDELGLGDDLLIPFGRIFIFGDSEFEQSFTFGFLFLSSFFIFHRF